MHKNKDQRVIILIDVQNLYHSSKNIHSARVNYKELIDSLVSGRKFIRAIGYVVKTDSNTGESSFFDALEKSGIDLKVKDIQVFQDGLKKADWDIGMAIDSIRLSASADIIILVTGDGDFIPLVEYLKIGLGKTVEVAAFGRSASSKLKEIADEFIDLDEKPEVILQKNTSSQSFNLDHKEIEREIQEIENKLEKKKRTTKKKVPQIKNNIQNNSEKKEIYQD